MSMPGTMSIKTNQIYISEQSRRERMTQIFKGKCITNRHRIFACVYDVAFSRSGKKGVFFSKHPVVPRELGCQSLWSATQYIGHSDLFSRYPFGNCWRNFSPILQLIWLLDFGNVLIAENYLKIVMAFYSIFFKFLFYDFLLKKQPKSKVVIL